jgi:hypothetical protein
VCAHMEGKERGGPGMDDAWCHVRAAVPGRAWEWQGKGERELAGGLSRRVGPA